MWGLHFSLCFPPITDIIQRPKANQATVFQIPIWPSLSSTVLLAWAEAILKLSTTSPMLPDEAFPSPPPTRWRLVRQTSGHKAPGSSPSTGKHSGVKTSSPHSIRSLLFFVRFLSKAPRTSQRTVSTWRRAVPSFNALEECNLSPRV